MDLMKMDKRALWIMACDRGVIQGDTSFYNMDGYSKSDLVELIRENVKAQMEALTQTVR